MAPNVDGTWFATSSLWSQPIVLKVWVSVFFVFNLSDTLLDMFEMRLI